ncbi:hypothetical protein GCM10017784_18180 [Deinococcus indicus]|uniref:tetratricopeptide repeat protein n=1 Tax=Deinococcus indicus TaxID=223556 RepID=UPI001748B06B|nr:tetratricopeptide repeat protein [Deinococcus indicus]GHG26180.1 hypothetical protein GCM10017784_18180 [Deinococcus indicus]
MATPGFPDRAATSHSLAPSPDVRAALGVPSHVTSRLLSAAGVLTGAALCLSAAQGFVLGQARTQAQLAREQGQYDLATQRLQRALRFTPHAWEGWSDLALTARSAWVFQQRPEQLALALSAYARAASLNPQSAVPRTERARTFLVAGQASNAMDEYRNALARDPHSPGLRVAFAQALEAGGQPDAALEQYRAAARIDANEYSQDAERRLAPPAPPAVGER